MRTTINQASVFVQVRKKLLNFMTQLIQFTDQQTQLKKQQAVEKYLSVCHY